MAYNFQFLLVLLYSMTDPLVFSAFGSCRLIRTARAHRYEALLVVIPRNPSDRSGTKALPPANGHDVKDSSSGSKTQSGPEANYMLNA